VDTPSSPFLSCETALLLFASPDKRKWKLIHFCAYMDGIRLSILLAGCQSTGSDRTQLHRCFDPTIYILRFKDTLECLGFDRVFTQMHRCSDPRCCIESPSGRTQRHRCYDWIVCHTYTCVTMDILECGPGTRIYIWCKDSFEHLGFDRVFTQRHRCLDPMCCVESHSGRTQRRRCSDWSVRRIYICIIRDSTYGVWTWYLHIMVHIYIYSRTFWVRSCVYTEVSLFGSTFLLRKLHWQKSEASVF
jgi:hypothetical protein